MTSSCQAETAANSKSHVSMRQIVRENYFSTMEIPLLRGRVFTAQDGPHAPACSDRKTRPSNTCSFQAKRFLANVTFKHKKVEVEIVGVVADAKYMSQRRGAPAPDLYTVATGSC
jgi:hypothetical protein